MARRIGIVNLTRMGDLVQSTPLLRALRLAYSEAEIVLITLPAFREVGERLPMVDHVVDFDLDHMLPELDGRKGHLGRAWQELSEWCHDAHLSDVDIVVNLSHTQPSAWLCRVLEPKETWGLLRAKTGHPRVRGKWFDYLFSVMADRALNPFNLVEIYQRLTDLPVASSRLEFSVRPEDRVKALRLLRESGLDPGKPFFVLQPGANDKVRQWPVSGFVKLLHLLTENGHQVVLVGSREDVPLAEQILEGGSSSAVSLAGRTSIGTLAAVLWEAEKLVSNDTGTIHLSAAVGTPSIGIYLGPASAKDTGPYGSGHIVIEADLPCAPCHYQDTCTVRSCASAVRAEDVYRLLMAKGSNLPSVAEHMTGVRVYRTSVDHTGRWSLQSLNQHTCGTDPVLLDQWRYFWDRLLKTPSLNALRQEGRQGPISADSVDALRQIARQGRHAVNLLKQASEKGAGGSELEVQIRSQQDWQNGLSGLQHCQPDAAPFIRFLLTRLNTSHPSTIEELIEHLQSTLHLLERGIDLLTAKVSAQPAELAEEAHG